MFMSELASGLGEGEEERHLTSPSPTPPPSPQQPTVNESTSLECTDFTGLDDPFLMQFTDIEGLLQDTNMISQSPASSFSNSTPSPVTDHNFFLDLSASTSVNVNPVSPFSSNHSDNLAFEFSDDVFCVDSPKDNHSPLLSEAVIQHDHPYATPPSKPSRKRNASDTETNTTKKPKTLVKDGRYFERRHKNNLASQVSRAKRKNKRSGMFDKVTELEEQNAELRTRVEEMTAEAERLKELLVNRLAQ